MKNEEYLQMRIDKENEWIYNKMYSPKAIFLGIITLGFYAMAQRMNYLRRVGLY